MAAAGVSSVPAVICSVNRALLDSPVCLSSAHREACVAGSPVPPGTASLQAEGKPCRKKTRFIIKIDVGSKRACVRSPAKPQEPGSVHAARGPGKPERPGRKGDAASGRTADLQSMCSWAPRGVRAEGARKSPVASRAVRTPSPAPSQGKAQGRTLVWTRHLCTH